MAGVGANPGRRTRILLVDDFEDERSALRAVLQTAGFEVAEAASGAEGLLRAAESPDLIILDVNLPDIDAFEVCHRLKSTPATATIPVLHVAAAHPRAHDRVRGLAAHPGPHDRVRGLENGADAYLTQPVAHDELLATINALIRMRRAEAALRESEERYRRLMEAAVDGVCTLDGGGLITHANAQMAAMLGYDPGDLAGRPFADLVDPTAQAGLAQRLRDWQRGRRERRDLLFRRKDGGGVWAIVSAVPLAERADGAGALLVVTDVTDRLRTEKAQRQMAALRSVATLAAAASHEINNPLAVIQGHLEILATPGGASPEVSYRVARVLRAVNEIRDVVRRMSSITRLELADAPPDLPARLDLRKSAGGDRA
jgi:PAS domain S-box-containing protein